MPAGRRPPTNTMLYTLITFVGLFIITTALTVIYYVKAEKQRKIAVTSQNQLNEMASPAELRKIGALVGAKQPRKSRLGTMLDYLDRTASLIIGGLPEETSAEVKIDTVNRKVKDISEMVARGYPDIGNSDPNTTGLVRTIEKLKAKLDNTTDTALALEKRLKELQNQFNDATTANFEKEQILLAEKEKYQQQVNDIAQDYDELRTLLAQTSQQQVQTLAAQLDEERDNSKALKQQLLKTQAELKITQNRIKHIQAQLQVTVPPPDSEVAAYKPDGKIILIDDKTKIVHLNIGSNDGVYRGLTFSVYDKTLPIPKTGRGKAEIEVFNVRKNISAAQITRSEIKRPITLDDIVANLIWDSDKTNVFVVAGDFDLDSDGYIDYNAVDKINALIEKWGGRAVDAITIDTDFLVLGRAPKVLQRPTFEEIEVDPMATEKYENSLQRLDHYKEVLKQAQDLAIPVFNTERFLYFIGYKAQSDSPGAF